MHDVSNSLPFQKSNVQSKADKPESLAPPATLDEGKDDEANVEEPAEVAVADNKSMRIDGETYWGVITY